jgi:outer membrane protein assembly factor BamB
MALDNGEPILALETQQRSALFIWDESSTMTAVDATSGETLWATQTADATGPQSNDTGSPAPVVALDVVAMVDASGTVQAFDRDSGENLWSQPGFDGIDTRMAFQQGTLFVLSGDGQKSGGLQHLTAAGLDLESGDIKWEVEMVGPLYQPVATNETSFYVIANEVVTPSALEDTEQTLVDYDGPGAGSWTGSKVAMAEPDVGGTHVFGIDAETGSVIWSRSSLAGRFMQVWTGCPNSCGLRAATSDGYVVGLGRDSGSVSGDSTVLNGEPVEIISGGATALNGQFATLADGTLVAFGHVPYREQG